MEKCWSVTNLSDSEAEIFFYGPIAADRPIWDKESRLLEMVCPGDFIADMQKLSGKTKLIFHMNSNGGDVFAAFAMANYLKGLKVKKIGKADGVVASACTILMNAMDVIESPYNAFFLYHNPKYNFWDVALSADELDACADDLRTIKEAMLDDYMSRSSVNITREDLSSLMDEDKWITGREAKDMGLVDKLLFDKVSMSASAIGRAVVINGVQFDFSAYINKPKIEDMEANNDEEEEQDTVKIENVEQFKSEYPDIYNEVVKVGVDTERTRIKEIEAIASTMPVEMVSAAKFEKPVTARDLAFEAAVANKGLGEDYLKKREVDAEKSGAGKIGAAGDPPPDRDGDKKKKTSLFAAMVSAVDRTVNNKEA